MTTPYDAIIAGENRQITGRDEHGNYFLADGSKLVFKPLGGDAFLAYKLNRIAKLAFAGGEWMLDGKNLKVRIVSAMIKRRENHAARTDDETLHALEVTLSALPEAECGRITGVAWFDERAELVAGETIQSCEERERFLGEMIGPDKVGKILPLPSAKRFEPVLLTDFGVVHPVPPALNRDQADMIVLGRIRYTPGFDDVWVDGEHFDLRKRRKARACLQYLVENRCFNEQAARHLENEIDPYVREQSGGLPKTADIRIHHYFVDAQNRFEKLRNLVCAAGRGRFFLKMT